MCSHARLAAGRNHVEHLYASCATAKVWLHRANPGVAACNAACMWPLRGSASSARKLLGLAGRVEARGRELYGEA